MLGRFPFMILYPQNEGLCYHGTCSCGQSGPLMMINGLTLMQPSHASTKT